jgi:4-hydroxybenzoate polyprenyltransferase
VEQWWSFKLIPPLIAAYIGCIMADVAIAAQWRALLAVLIGLASSAAAVSVINDLFDRADDRRAGKLNRLEGASRRQVVLRLLPPVAIAAAVMWWWRDEHVVAGLYAALWIVFACYSIPPLRLKGRGLLGAIADATGANLLPILLAIVATAPGRPNTWLVVTSTTWALSFGLRGIVWHQLGDVAGDRRSGVATFVVAATPERVRGLMLKWLFPLELVAVGGLIILSQSWEGVFALCLYALTVGKVKRHFGSRSIVLADADGGEPLMHDFYFVLLPLSLLIESALRHSSDVLVLVVHLLIFASAVFAYASEILHWRKR